ncbi:outer membrane usher protein [Providencia stuartii]|uniref:outer membrane usher protein n=1 Tax=Providencia stuartii TaxID=588 RepID=UPI0024AAAB96|nr:outer membrane usher protein [Providencia stuartii]MCR4081925.1 outer membrane usher protein [Providencia stuartii]
MMTLNCISAPLLGISRPRWLGLFVSIVLCSQSYAADIEFNTDILDVNDRANIDLSQFSRPGYLMPGEYRFTVFLNKHSLPEQTVFYYAPDDQPDESLACLSPTLVELLGLKPELLPTLQWWHQGQCLSLASLPGTEVKADLAASALYISLPQAYLEYTAENWDPPARWEEGLSGALFDYNVNAQVGQQTRGGQRTNMSTSGNGVAGVNLGVWRARADWQLRLDKQQGQGTTSSLDWTRYYVYRAIKALGAKLTLGEDYLVSDIFDSFRFTGLSLITDTNMLPPNLRGYAPEITGVAKSNATVIVSQQGRIIYQTQVAAGPFRIQDLNDALAGELNVEVKEQDGSSQTFTVSTASVPYLTRPGQLRYKLAAGRPTDWRHHVSGETFASGEFSWGVNNGWSLYGGGIAAENYASAAVGIGRDLLMFGALSFDITHARSRLKGLTEIGDKTYRGSSYRLSYSKRFDAYNSQVTFAGYRFSEQGFMSMSEYLDAQSTGVRQYNSKEMYAISYNQQFPEIGLSAYINYYHQTYWDQPDNDRYSVSLARYFDIGKWKNISLNLTAYRNQYRETKDDGVYASLSVPWGEKGTLSLNSSWDKNDNTQRASYYDRIDERSNYQLSTGWSRSGALVSGYYTHDGNLAQINANATYQQDRYRSAGLSFQGGFTATEKGAVMHRNNQLGGTRIFVETDGVADIPLRGYGSTVRTNRFGQAVLTDVNSYYRNQVSVDLNTLPEEAQVAQSVKQGTLTEGAIGYRQFEVVSGHSAMALLRLADNSTPPFGAQVFNARGQQVGMVGDDGSTYLTGLNANDILQLRWDDSVQCEITLPSVLPDNDTLLSNWLLPCHSPGRQSSPVVKSAAVSTPLPSGKPAMRDDLTCTTSCQAEMKPVIEPANSQATRWLLK